MASLSTPAICLKAFYRLCGVTTTDQGLVEQGETADDVGYLCLNHGIEAAQRFMIACGMTDRWRTRGIAITTWSGTDAADGGRYKALSALIASGKEFLRFSGKKNSAQFSSLTEVNGARWGVEVDADYDTMTGDYYYLKDEQLWVGTDSAPPATLYVDYQYKHPEFTSSVTLDFPSDARGLIIAYAGQHASAEGWFPLADGEARIKRNVEFWEKEARKVARRSRGPRKQNAPRFTGTRFFA